MALLIEDNNPEPAGPWWSVTAPPAARTYPSEPVAGPPDEGYPRAGYDDGYPGDGYDGYAQGGYGSQGGYGDYPPGGSGSYPPGGYGSGYPAAGDTQGARKPSWGPPAYLDTSRDEPDVRLYSGQDTQPLGLGRAAAMAAATDDTFAAEEYPDGGWDGDEPEPEPEPEPGPEGDRGPAGRERPDRVLGPALGRAGRRFWARPQWLAVLLIAVAAIVVAVSLPTFLRPGSRQFRGVVSSSQLTGLNFRVGGQIAAIRVRLGQAVRQGQVLAVTDAAAVKATAVQADEAAVQADKANVAVLAANAAPAASVTAAQATLAQARAQQATDWRKLLRREILAPRSGVVAAIDAAVGQLDGPAGLPARVAANAARQGGIVTILGAGGRALPLIALRIPGGWQIRVRLPQAFAAAVRVGEPVGVSIPALRRSGIRGHVVELLQGQAAAGGTDAVIEVTGVSISPPQGTAAEVRIRA
jgi:multidrug efflux pump subunit AcrA (membrane-fusion protein)